jgi:hypothetical protein
MAPGLHHQLADMKRQAAEKRAIADDPASAPFIGYSAHEDAMRLGREMADLGIAIEDTALAIHRIQEHMDFLHASPHKSRLRSLALTDLEQAQDRLRRELGDKPE